MTERKKGLATLGLDNAIRLRWAVRDIHAKRLKWSPISPEDLQTLVSMGYVEVVDGALLITLTGMDECPIRHRVT
jgi:hypothetical protein